MRRESTPRQSRTLTVLTLAVALGGAAPGPARADEAAPTGEPAAARAAPGPAALTRYDFDDDLVEGELLTPGDAVVTGRWRIIHASMIPRREHFLPEMLRAAAEVE